MKLKIVDGVAALQDGKPVYVLDDGREIAHDAASTVATISRLNGEAKQHRERAEEFAAKLKGYEGIDDPEVAKQALEKVKALSSGEMKTAEQVEAMRKGIETSYSERLNAATAREKAIAKERDQVLQDRDNLIKKTAFAGSKFIKEKLNIPPDIAESFFGNRVKVVEGGKLVALSQDGNPLYSAVNHGQPADFDEAIMVMVNEYPNRNSILKQGGTGGGSPGQGQGQGGGNGKFATRAQFDAFTPQQRMDFSVGGGQIADQ